MFRFLSGRHRGVEVVLSVLDQPGHLLGRVEELATTYGPRGRGVGGRALRPVSVWESPFDVVGVDAVGVQVVRRESHVLNQVPGRMGVPRHPATCQGLGEGSQRGGQSGVGTALTELAGDRLSYPGSLHASEHTWAGPSHRGAAGFFGRPGGTRTDDER